MDTSGDDRPQAPGWYEIRLQGGLDPHWSPWLADMDITSGTDGTTLIHGLVADQAALHGLLARIRDIGLPLLSVARVEPDRSPDAAHRVHPTGD